MDPPNWQRKGISFEGSTAKPEVTTKGKFKNKTAYIRTSKWSFVLLFSLLLLLVILFFFLSEDKLKEAC